MSYTYLHTTLYLAVGGREMILNLSFSTAINITVFQQKLTTCISLISHPSLNGFPNAATARLSHTLDRFSTLLKLLISATQCST